MRAVSLVSSAPSFTFDRRPQYLNRYLATTLPRQCKTRSFSNVRLVAMASAQNADNINVLKSVPVRVAHELIQAGYRYLDVRTPEEFSSGHPLGAINVPYMLSAGIGMRRNPNFVEEVKKHFRKDDEIVVGCLTGKRSRMAATDLAYAGYNGVIDLAGGYASWKLNGLPME